MPAAVDEYYFDFFDNRNSLPKRWHDLCDEALRKIPQADRPDVLDCNTVEVLAQRFAEKARSSGLPATAFHRLGPVFRTFDGFMKQFVAVMKPSEVRIGTLWGLMYTQLSHQCINASDDEGEVRLCMVDFLDALLLGFVESIKFHRRYANTQDAISELPKLGLRLENYLKQMEDAVKHLHEIGNYGRKVQEWQRIYERQSRLPNRPVVNQPGVNFPLISLPTVPSEKFFFREELLAKIDEHLDYRKEGGLRTYTIFGRRGIGKTELALPYAMQNKPKFDAIFWIRCETGAAIRQSFADMAFKLKLPGASRLGNHEENVRLVLKWLADTEKTWLLIYDNAEQEDLVRNHWPECSGAILITSRNWTNFNNDAKRKGETVPRFTDDQSWTFIRSLLGWDSRILDGSISNADIVAMKEVLSQLSGLPLAIKHVAHTLLYQNKYNTAQVFLQEFDKARKKLPPKQIGERSPAVEALDTIWYMTYTSLSENARRLLNVLCLWSPDRILVDRFLPQHEHALGDYLSFCWTDDAAAGVFLDLPAGLNEVLRELTGYSLIRRAGRVLDVHRVVQEAVIELSNTDLHIAFKVAVTLVYETFPKQVNGRLFNNVWSKCAASIQHAESLAKRYNRLAKAEENRLGPDTHVFSKALQVSTLSETISLEPPPEFAELLKNCAWYLYEIGAYKESFKMLNTGLDIVDPNSELAAHFLNTAGLCYFEQNMLKDCRNALERSYAIRKDLMDTEGEEFANSISNIANLEAAVGKHELALSYHEKVEAIRHKLPVVEVAGALAITYICKGRCYTRMKQFDRAAACFDAAGALISRESEKSPAMASLCFVKGNLARRSDNPQEAIRCYEKAIKIMNEENPAHVLTSSLYFKKACAEMEIGYLDNATTSLNKAYSLADRSRVGMYDGNVARILWKRSELLGLEIFDYVAVPDEAAKLRDEAERMKLQIGGSAGIIFDDPEHSEQPDGEVIYDLLVCDFWRT